MRKGPRGNDGCDRTLLQVDDIDGVVLGDGDEGEAAVGIRHHMRGVSADRDLPDDASGQIGRVELDQHALVHVVFRAALHRHH
ncbi:MAG: hypothetical protein ACOY3L_01970 [Pseudomonadota bacterium]